MLTPWAGEGYEARFLPRIGEIVVIDFFDGNISRPFVIGQIHEAHRSPTKFDDKGKLSDTKKLAGSESKEYQGKGFNQLRFDDTTGQISAQLQIGYWFTVAQENSRQYFKQGEILPEIKKQDWDEAYWQFDSDV